MEKLRHLVYQHPKEIVIKFYRILPDFQPFKTNNKFQKNFTFFKIYFNRLEVFPRKYFSKHLHPTLHQDFSIMIPQLSHQFPQGFYRIAVIPQSCTK